MNPQSDDGFTHLALINSALRLVLHGKAGEAALFGSPGKRTKRAAQAAAGGVAALSPGE